jgi:hypothetical protein
VFKTRLARMLWIALIRDLALFDNLNYGIDPLILSIILREYSLNALIMPLKTVML